jgi:tetratricopeptide (TPR) repeat protein
VTLAQLLLLNQNPYQAAKVLEAGRAKKVLKINEETKEETLVVVVKDNEKNLRLLADSWRMSQEIETAIPILEKAAKMSKDGKNYVLLGNLYLAEDNLELAIDSIKKGLEKGKVSKVSQVYLTLGQAYFELQMFNEAKKQFGKAARDKDKQVIATANNWIRYTEREEERVKNLELRREFIKNS